MSYQHVLPHLNQKDLFEAVFILENTLSETTHHIGTDGLPEHEVVNISVQPSLGFSFSEVAKVEYSAEGKFEIDCHYLALTGEQAVLPQHYTDLILERNKAGDRALGEFFNIFNHRLLSLNYRAWLKHQPSFQLKAHSHGRQSSYIDLLMRITGSESLLHVYYARLFANKVRSRRVVQSVLEDISGCKVELHEFVGEWVNLKPSEQSRLSCKQYPKGQHVQLGGGATLGRRAWDVNAGYGVEFIAQSEEQVTNMLANTPRHQLVMALGNQIIGTMKSVKYQLSAKQKYLPKHCLGKKTSRLGVGGVLAHSQLANEKKITITI